MQQENQGVNIESITISDKSKVPLRWLMAICTTVITMVMVQAANNFSEMKTELKEINKSVGVLNTNVSVLLNDKENTKARLDSLDHRIEKIEFRYQGK